MNEDLLTTNQIINSNLKSELVVPIKNTLQYKFFISSANRDINMYPAAANFSIKLPIEITNVSDITLTDINIKRKAKIFNQYDILEWGYSNDIDHIPLEKINNIEKIDNHFNLNKVLYGYTKSFKTKGCCILFNFKSANIIHLSLFGDDESDTYNLFNTITIDDLAPDDSIHKPINITFRAIDENIVYNYTLNSITQINTNDPKMKKVYILNVISSENYIKPFNNYFTKSGHILMYVYHPIDDEISKYIPVKYKNNGYLRDYEKLLKNPTIHNNDVFGVKSNLINMSDVLGGKDILIDSEIDELLNIDRPDNNIFSIYVNDVQTLEECKMKIQTINTAYNFNNYIWKFTYKESILLEHFKTLRVTLTYKSNKVYINTNELQIGDIVYINNKYYSLYRDENKNLFYYTNSHTPAAGGNRELCVLSNCIITENTKKFFNSMKINYIKSGSNWNNFNISKKVPITKLFVYGIHNQVVLELHTLDGFNIGDKVVIRNSRIENKGILHDNIPKFISKIYKREHTYLVTIDLDTFFVGDNETNEFYEYGSGGYIAKILEPKSLSYKGDIYFNLKHCNYIDILNSSDIRKVFSIINKNNNIIGGKFQTNTFIKNLEKINIDLLKTDNKPCSDIDYVSMILTITKVKKVDT